MEASSLQALEWLETNAACVKVRKDCINGYIGAIQSDGSNVLVDWIQTNKVEQASGKLHGTRANAQLLRFRPTLY
jgi:hypothetical protein